LRLHLEQGMLSAGRNRHSQVQLTGRLCARGRQLLVLGRVLWQRAVPSRPSHGQAHLRQRLRECGRGMHDQPGLLHRHGVPGDAGIDRRRLRSPHATKRARCRRGHRRPAGLRLLRAGVFAFDPMLCHLLHKQQRLGLHGHGSGLHLLQPRVNPAGKLQCLPAGGCRVSGGRATAPPWPAGGPRSA